MYVKALLHQFIGIAAHHLVCKVIITFVDQRIPTVLIPMFERYLSLANQQLGGFLKAFYVVGSIALDEFNSYFSDVDFFAVIDRPATKGDVEILSGIHKEIERRYPRWKLSGMYLLESGIGKEVSEIENILTFHEGVLGVRSNFEFNPVTWWILKNHGIVLLGSDSQHLPIIVDLKALVEWTIENMNTYWRSWTQRPGRLAALLTDWGIQWTVLGISRQFYTIREKSIISKQRAGEYALSAVPPSWHPLIKEAIRIRTKASGSMYRSRWRRVMDTVHFINYIIEISNEQMR